MTMSGSGGEMLLISHNTSQVRSLMMLRTIVGKGELSKDEVSWERDLELTYWKTC